MGAQLSRDLGCECEDRQYIPEDPERQYGPAYRAKLDQHQQDVGQREKLLKSFQELKELQVYGVRR
jgi:hypothetical protein